MCQQPITPAAAAGVDPDDMTTDATPRPPVAVRSWFRLANPARTAAGCGCECNSGGFCGGCGHAGCGRR